MATKNRNTLMAGALAAGIAGSLAAAAILWSKKNKNGTFFSRERATNLLSKINGWNHFGQSKFNNKVFGSLAGTVIGATTALLFAPKSGKGLVHDIMKSIQKNKPARAKVQATPKRLQVTRTKVTVKRKSPTKKKSTR